MVVSSFRKALAPGCDQPGVPTGRGFVTSMSEQPMLARFHAVTAGLLERYTETRAKVVHSRSSAKSMRVINSLEQATNCSDGDWAARTHPGSNPTT
jgi:hypothetical protein